MWWWLFLQYCMKTYNNNETSNAHHHFYWCCTSCRVNYSSVIKGFSMKSYKCSFYHINNLHEAIFLCFVLLTTFSLENEVPQCRIRYRIPPPLLTYCKDSIIQQNSNVNKTIAPSRYKIKHVCTQWYFELLLSYYKY